MRTECEHALNLIDEEWLDDNKVIVTLKCDICNTIFSGEVTK